MVFFFNGIAQSFLCVEISQPLKLAKNWLFLQNVNFLVLGCRFNSCEDMFVISYCMKERFPKYKLTWFTKQPGVEIVEMGRHYGKFLTF